MIEFGCGADASGKHTIAIGEDILPFRILIDGRPVGPPLGSRMRAEMVAEWVKGLDDVGALLGDGASPRKDLAVGEIVELLEGGVSCEEIMRRHPGVTPDGLGACAAFAVLPGPTPSWRDRIVFPPGESEADPMVKGTWVGVRRVVSLIAGGMSWSDILRIHPGLTADDIRACCAYAAEEGGDA